MAQGGLDEDFRFRSHDHGAFSYRIFRCKSLSLKAFHKSSCLLGRGFRRLAGIIYIKREELSRIVERNRHIRFERTPVRETCYKDSIGRHGGKKPVTVMVCDLDGCGLSACICILIEKSYSNTGPYDKERKDRKTKYEGFPAHYLTAIASISTFTPRGRAAA